MLPLRCIAHARSGDKGAHANIAVIAYTEPAYLFLKTTLTENRVYTYFHSLNPDKVIRFELPNLLAFNFLLYNVLDGGGSRSLRLDAQGKSLAQALLEVSLDIPQHLPLDSFPLSGYPDVPTNQAS